MMKRKKAQKEFASIVERIHITGIHGTSKAFDIRMKDDCLILVGENGSGKSTFLRILCNLMAGRWLSLLQTKFDTVTITIKGVDISVRHQDLSKVLEKSERGPLRNLPSAVRRRIQHAIESGEAAHNPEIFEHLAHSYGVPTRYMVEQIRLIEDESPATSKNLPKGLSQIRESLNAQVLYLPTYRRIERDLASIFEGFDSSDLRQHRRMRSRQQESNSYFLELVEFGMGDVKEAIEKALANLREFQREGLNSLTLRYLGDIVNGVYQTAETDDFENANETDVRAVLNRMDENILPSGERESWLHAIREAKANRDNSEHNLIIRHYFGKLLKFQQSLQTRESNISAFCRLCNQYITDKRFIYDNATFSVRVHPIEPKNSSSGEIELGDLSSGEKQIVSLFSHLYLSGQERYFVLIDEPELSLSVPWQKRFLVDIRSASFCAGLVAVTHSPFIYDNELKPYAHALGEFMVNE